MKLLLLEQGQISARVKVMEPQIGEKEIYNHGEQFENVDNNSSTTTSNNIDNTNKNFKGLNVVEPRLC